MLSGIRQAESGQGTAGAIITIFGLDDQSREVLAERWSQWWGEHYEPAPGSCGNDAGSS